MGVYMGTFGTYNNIIYNIILCSFIQDSSAEDPSG